MAGLRPEQDVDRQDNHAGGAPLGPTKPVSAAAFARPAKLQQAPAGGGGFGLTDMTDDLDTDDTNLTPAQLNARMKAQMADDDGLNSNVRAMPNVRPGGGQLATAPALTGAAATSGGGTGTGSAMGLPQVSTASGLGGGNAGAAPVGSGRVGALTGAGPGIGQGQQYQQPQATGTQQPMVQTGTLQQQGYTAAPQQVGQQQLQAQQPGYATAAQAMLQQAAPQQGYPAAMPTQPMRPVNGQVLQQHPQPPLQTQQQQGYAQSLPPQQQQGYAQPQQPQQGYAQPPLLQQQQGYAQPQLPQQQQGYAQSPAPQQQSGYAQPPPQQQGYAKLPQQPQQGYAQPPPLQQQQGYAQPPAPQQQQGYAQPPAPQQQQGYPQPLTLQQQQSYAQAPAPQQQGYAQPPPPQPQQVYAQSPPPQKGYAQPPPPQQQQGNAQPQQQQGHGTALPAPQVQGKAAQLQQGLAQLQQPQQGQQQSGPDQQQQQPSYGAPPAHLAQQQPVQGYAPPPALQPLQQPQQPPGVSLQQQAGALAPLQQGQPALQASGSTVSVPQQQQLGYLSAPLQQAQQTARYAAGQQQMQYGLTPELQRQPGLQQQYAPEQPPEQMNAGKYPDGQPQQQGPQGQLSGPYSQQQQPPQYGIQPDMERQQQQQSASAGLVGQGPSPYAQQLSQGGAPLQQPPGASPYAQQAQQQLHVQQLQQQMQQASLYGPGAGAQQYHPSAAAIATEGWAALAAVPPGQRYVNMTHAQADAIIAGMRAAPEGQAPPPKVVDVKDAHAKLVDSAGTRRLGYVRALELAAPVQRFPANVRPSLLQSKVKAGENRLSSVLQPTLQPGAAGFVDMRYNDAGGLIPEMEHTWQFALGLVKADGVPPTGLAGAREPCLNVCRVAIFDKQHNRFIGNVVGVRPADVRGKDSKWVFDPTQRIIIRCSCLQPDVRSGTHVVTEDQLSLYIEFNISYRLTVDDTLTMPPSETKAAGMVDELNTCWAMLGFARCTQSAEEVERSVPMYYGSIYDPQPLDALLKARRKAAPIASMFRAKEKPVLTFRVAPLDKIPAPMVPYAYMPTTMLALHDLATAMGAYRMTLSLALARRASPFAATGEPLLRAFPEIVQDAHLLKEFLVKWADMLTRLTAFLDTGCCSPTVLPPLPAVVEAFRRCTMEVAPLLHCESVPPKHINNFVEYQGHRLRIVQSYVHVVDPATNKIVGSRHPVEPLSHAGFEFLHKPFDVAETRLCLGDVLDD